MSIQNYFNQFQLMEQIQKFLNKFWMLKEDYCQWRVIRLLYGKIKEDTKMSVRNVNVFYGDKQAIFDVHMDIKKNEVIAMIGPSGWQVNIFTTLNRMNDTIGYT